MSLRKVFLMPLLAALLFTGCGQTQPVIEPTPVSAETLIKIVVEEWGKVLKQVSLTAEYELTKQSIQANYQPFLTPTLLTTWSNNPSLAIGKLTSGPWPDRIEISQLTKMADDQYHVLGNIIQVTSDSQSTAMNVGIDITVQKTANQWLISQVVLLDTGSNEANLYDENGITIQYPGTLKVASGVDLGGSKLDTTIVKFLIPKEIIASENTNFNQAYLLVSKSTKPETISSCASFADLGSVNELSESVTINGIQFSSQDSSETAAGNMYDSKLYRTVHKSTCYELAMVTHTSTINNYSPPVIEFNHAEALAILTPVLASFGFQD